jgi:UDP-glucose 4-epimerase
MAAQKPQECLQTNGSMTWALLEAARQMALHIRFVNLSSYHVYGPRREGLIKETDCTDPGHPYAIGHRIAETVTRSFHLAHNMATLSARLTNVFGYPVCKETAKWVLVFNDLCRQAVMDGQLVLKTSGLQQRNFLPMGDAVDALLFLAQQPDKWPADGLINVAGLNDWSILDVADRVRQRAELLFGDSVEIVAPRPEGNDVNPVPVQVDRSRLEKMGFSWSNSWEEEIDRTLLSCRQWYGRKH